MFACHHTPQCFLSGAQQQRVLCHQSLVPAVCKYGRPNTNVTYHITAWFSTTLLHSVTCSSMVISPSCAAHVQLDEQLHHHMVDVLDEAASRQLFRQKAGLGGDPEAALQEVEAAILTACGGLPLALRLMGGQLYKKHDEASWQVMALHHRMLCMRSERAVQPTR
jgi:hypothetical protein